MDFLAECDFTSFGLSEVHIMDGKLVQLNLAFINLNLTVDKSCNQTFESIKPVPPVMNTRMGEVYFGICIKQPSYSRQGILDSCLLQ